MAKRDFLVKGAIDALSEGRSEAAELAALFMLVTAVGAALMRVLSRITIFTGGRNVEYELRAALLARLHKLGPSFFRRMPTGEIMSRATNDLAQVRLLLGFGVLNVIERRLRHQRAPSGSWSTCREAHARVARDAARADARHAELLGEALPAQPREPGGHRQDERSRAREPLGRARGAQRSRSRRPRSRAFEETNQATSRRASPRALRGSMGPLMGAISSVGHAHRVLVRRAPRARGRHDEGRLRLVLARAPAPHVAAARARLRRGDRAARARRLRSGFAPSSTPSPTS
jgi:ATP-binding cassette subfamily B multidrug efflux pump